MVYRKSIRIFIVEICCTLCFKNSSKTKFGVISREDTDKTSYCILQTSGFNSQPVKQCLSNLVLNIEWKEAKSLRALGLQLLPKFLSSL